MSDTLPSPDEASAVGREVIARPAFAHASEAELARILDFYAVRWEYEPHVFPILWSLDGRVAESSRLTSTCPTSTCTWS